MIKRSPRKDRPIIATGGLLARYVNGNAEHPTFIKLVALARTSDAPIESVIAYRSFRKARDEQRVGERDLSAKAKGDQFYHLLGGETFVPEEDTRSDAELLRRAARFAARPVLREIRQAFNGWVKRLSEGGVTPEEARGHLEKLLAEHKKPTRGAWRHGVIRWVGRLAPVAAPFAALLDP